MDEQLRKRLDEAIKETLNCDNCVCKEVGECFGTSMCPLYRHALKCAELGYKEAIKVAREWLLGKIRIEIDADGTIRETDGKVFFHQLAEELETDMHKLWEEKK